MNVSAKIIVEEVGSVLALPVEAVERGNTVLVAKEAAWMKTASSRISPPPRSAR